MARRPIRDNDKIAMKDCLTRTGPLIRNPVDISTSDVLQEGAEKSGAVRKQWRASAACFI